MIPKFKAQAHKGYLLHDDPAAFSNYISKFEGQTVYVAVSTRKPTRSNQQNRYYHGVVVKMLSDETGYTTDDMHEYLKLEFNHKIIVVNGVEKRIPMSTSVLKTDEMESFLSRIRTWASMMLRLSIPEPNEVVYD